MSLQAIEHFAWTSRFEEGNIFHRHLQGILFEEFTSLRIPAVDGGFRHASADDAGIFDRIKELTIRRKPKVSNVHAYYAITGNQRRPFWTWDNTSVTDAKEQKSC